ncbi:MAG TPA: uroporphyrinogen decarboxylase family protein [Tissierellales bacterium]|nr:uroporphyrinogen decarboxylase family protein [Tissierellales bacterium]
MENVDFKCASDNLEEIPEEVVKEIGIDFPEVHTEAEYIASLSKELKKYKEDILCRVPFCNTVEAEALGGKIKLGDSKTGPRVDKYAFNSIEEMLNIKDMELTKGRINEVLKAIEILKKDGEKVILNVEGPITIITSLIDSRIFYRGLRKNKDVVDEFLKVIEENTIKYINEGITRGADIISYGDPVGALNIVGPKVFKEVSGKAALNILKKIENNLDGSIISLCGQLSTAFQKMDLVKAHPVKFEKDITYGEAIDYVLQNRKDVNIIGHNCIKRTYLKLKNSTLWSVELI